MDIFLILKVVYILANIVMLLVFMNHVEKCGYRDTFDGITVWMYLFFSPAFLLGSILVFVPYKIKKD